MSFTNLGIFTASWSFNGSTFEHSDSITIPASSSYLIVRICRTSGAQGVGDVQFDGNSLIQLVESNTSNVGVSSIYYLENPSAITGNLTYFGSSTNQISTVDVILSDATLTAGIGITGYKVSPNSSNVWPTQTSFATSPGDVILDLLTIDAGSNDLNISGGLNQNVQVLDTTSSRASSKTVAVGPILDLENDVPARTLVVGSEYEIITKGGTPSSIIALITDDTGSGTNGDFLQGDKFVVKTQWEAGTGINFTNEEWQETGNVTGMSYGHDGGFLSYQSVYVSFSSTPPPSGIVDGQQDYAFTYDNSTITGSVTEVNLKATNGSDLNYSQSLNFDTSGTNGLLIDFPDISSYTSDTLGVPFTSSVFTVSLEVTDGSNTTTDVIQWVPKTGYAKTDVASAVTTLGSYFYGFTGSVVDNTQVYYSTSDNTAIAPSGIFTTDMSTSGSLAASTFDLLSGTWIYWSITLESVYTSVPVGVTATSVSTDQINISWTPVATSGLSIERSLNNNSNWEEVYFCPSDDGDGQGNPIVKLFSHLPNTQYFYRLRHCVSIEESASYSEYSYVVNATTSTANNIYYVAPSGGSDSSVDGSSGSPFATVQHAIDVAVPGDIIRLQAGTHTAASNVFADLYHGPAGTPSEVYSIAEFDKSGTEALPYILEADPDAIVVLDCQAGTFRTGGLVGNIGVRIKSGNSRYTQSHIHIKNIEMIDVRGNGVHFPDNSPAHDDATVGIWSEGIVLENLTVNRLWGSNFLQKYVRADVNSSWVAESPEEYKSHRDDTYPRIDNGDATNWYDDTSTALIRWNLVGVNNAAYRLDNTRNSIFRNIKANDCYWNDQDNTDPIGRANHVAGIQWYGAWSNLVENCVFKDIGSVGIYQKASEDNTPATGWSVVARYNMVDSVYNATVFQLANVGEDHRFKLYNNILKNYYEGTNTGKNANLDQVILRNNVFDADGSFWGLGTSETGFGIRGPNDNDGVQQSVDTVITGNIFNGHKENMSLRAPIATGMVIDYNIYDTSGKWQIDVYDNHGGRAEYNTLTQWQTNTDKDGVQHLTSDFRPVSPDANSVEFTALTEVFTNSTADDYTIPAGSDAFNLISISESAGPYQYGGETIGSTTIVATPTISISSATQTVEVGGTYTEETATVYDASGNIVTGAVVTVTGDTVDANTVGTYSVYFDTPGAPRVIQVVYIADTNIPTITVDTLTQTLEVGGTYNPPSATASDAFYGDITSSIVINNTVDENTVGSYNVTWDVDDINGNSAIQQIQTVNVVDTVIPEIQLNDAAVKTIEYGTYVAPSVTATDNYDNDANLTSQIVQSGDVITASTDLGTYTVRYNVSDAAGNAASEVTQTITIQDTVAPVLNLNASSSINLNVGTAWTVPNVTATDTYDDDAVLTSQITQTGTVDPNTLSTYVVTWNVTDSNGNAAIPVSQTITVIDVGAPTILLNRSLTETIEVGASYSAPVPTAFDNADGNLTSSIVESGDALSSSSVGSFTRRYNVNDSNGNAAAEVVYTLTVSDTIKPIISIPLLSRTLEFGEYVAQTVTATDNFYGSIPVVTSGDTVNASSLPGTYAIRYNAVDQNGLDADEVVETIIIQDTIAPVINLVGSNNIDVEIDTTYTLPNVTATDAVDGNVALTVSGTVDTSTLGTYIITWNCSDSAGNAATEVTQTVNVVDTQIPVINLNAPAIIYLDIGIPYIAPSVTASDQNGAVDLTSNIITGGDVVNSGVPGTYVVTFNVSDASNNQALQVTQTVVVQEAVSEATRVTTWPTQTSPTGNEVFAIDDGTTFKKMTLDEITAYIINAINNP